MLAETLPLLTFLTFPFFVHLVAVSIILQYSDRFMLSFLRPREVLVIHEFALAVDCTVFERLAFLAVLAALLLRVVMLPTVDLLQRSAVLLNFFQDIRCCYAEFGLS